ncbi:MAG: nucleotide-diphospho-sugar transferase [Ignavibacteriales bacterium]|nr:nucleotide-diphospho-sugar transferase [Ignavibacteriales bacterium]
MESSSFDTPILFLIFNRPQTTEVVFKRIREVRPKHLFISADGPRQDRPDETRLCAEARNIITAIDWDCDVKTRYLENNLGCRIAVSSAISWFFDNVNEGIILEDDCVPDACFFHFTQSLLDYYRDDTRIMHIGGTNFQNGITRGTGSYYFSRLNHIWGWATWRRSWKKYDLVLSTYPEILERSVLSHVFYNRDMRNFWRKRFDLAYNNKIDTWDIQWQYAMTVNNGLSVIPNKNLVTNIGFHDAATHTHDGFHVLANIPTSPLNELQHPSLMIPNADADYYSFRKYFCPPKHKKLMHLLRRTVSNIRKSSTPL